MKFHQTLIIFLVVSNLLITNTAIPDELKAHIIQVTPSSVKLELPTPKTSELQKYIFNVNGEGQPELGFICHNFARERAIKDALFELQTKAELASKLEEKAVENKPEVSFIDKSNYWTIGLGFLAGAIFSVALNKKLK